MRSVTTTIGGPAAGPTVQQLLEDIAAHADVNAILEGVADLWERQSRGYPYLAVTLASADKDLMWVAAAPGLPAAFRGLMWSRASQGERSLFFGTDESFAHDLGAEPKPDERILLSQGIAAYWRCPILDGEGMLLGALIACAPGPATPDDAERDLMRQLAHLTRIAIEKNKAEHDLALLSNFDALTLLPNRTLLLDHLQGAVRSALEHECRTALLLLNLDGMSRINESLGYAFGDEVIRAVARRLRAHLKHDEMLARFGGDEFAVIVKYAPGEDGCTPIAQGLLDSVTRPLQVAGQEIIVTASLGAGSTTGVKDSADVLFRHADAALRHAKKCGGNSYRLYSASMDAPSGRLELLGELHRALDRGEFQVHYQPQQDARTGSVAGAEALLRWEHPQRGTVSPTEFVSLLEETGLIVAVGDWVVERVCADLQRLDALGLVTPRIAINLSLRQFHQGDLARRITDTLCAAGIDGGRLGVEITESLLVQEPELTEAALMSLRRIGMEVSVDDFGVGCSSLSYLKRFPVDVLKIDKSFIDGIAATGPDAHIVRAIVHMAHSLGIRTVAEGVETAAQRSTLQARRCDVLQGYLYSRPLSFDGFAAFLAKERGVGQGPRPMQRAAG
jgi:diguanylate cyclase (GGDEF)-like protein